MQTVGFWQNLKSKILYLFSYQKVDEHSVIKIFGIKICLKRKYNIELTPPKESGITKEKRSPKIIVSLTTYPDRINIVYKTITTLLEQTMKPDEVILWLAQEQFPDKKLPKSLTDLEQYGLSIRWCNDIRSYKKLIPTLREYPEDIIITFDDDYYYDKNTVKSLYEEYLNYPDCVIGTRAMRLIPNQKRHLFNLVRRSYVYDDTYLPSYLNTTIGFGGVLYPPKAMSKDVLDENKFMSIIPTNDDIWFWANTVKNGTKIVAMKNGYKIKHFPIENSQMSGLWKINGFDRINGINGDVGCNMFYNMYPEIREKLCGYLGEKPPKPYINNGKLKISVVMPVYNAEKYLIEAMESVTKQSLRDIEIICVNDGSKDNSLKILEQYASKDSRVKIIDKENQGYGATVNRGFAEAKGEFVAIFEPDDILDNKMYEKLYTNAIENDLDVVKCNFYYYWSLEKNKTKRSGLVKQCARKAPFNPKDNLKMFTCHASVWAGIYRKSFLENNNIKFLETQGASYQDMSFNFKVIASSPKIMLLEEPLLYYRQDNPNSSINNPAKVFCVCDEYDEITRFLNSNADLKDRFNAIKLINQYGAYLWNLKRLNKNLKMDFVKRFSDEFKTFYESGELNKDFYKNIKKSNIDMLINKPEKFCANFS